MTDPFSYLDVSSSYSDGVFTVTIKTKDGFTSSVINLAISKLGSCAGDTTKLAEEETTQSDTSATTNQSTTQTTQTDQSTAETQSTTDEDATTSADLPPITPGPTPTYGFIGEIKFRATIGNVSGETSSILTDSTTSSTLADNKTYTITIHTVPTDDTFTLEILGAKGNCLTASA